MKNEPNYPEIVNWAQFFPTDENKLGEFLVKSGRPVGCRLDFRITTLEELKKCAVIISELNQKVQHFAYEVEGDQIIRVMLARQLFQQAQFQLKYIDSKSFLKKAKEKAASEAFLVRGKKQVEARNKQNEKLRKQGKLNASIDLGDLVLGAVSVAEKALKVVPLPVTKKAIGYR